MMHRLTRRTSLFVALLLIFVSAAAADAKEPAENAAALRVYFSANGLLNRGLFDLAAAEYQGFIDAYPLHAKAPIARYGLGVSLFRLARYPEAAAALEAALAEESMPYPAEASVVLGQCFLSLGRHSEAAAALEPVLREHADHGLADDAAALQAEALYYDERYEQAQRPCRLLATRWPDSPHRERTELFWSMAEMALGDYTAAASRLRTLLETFPEGALADQTALLLAQSLHRSNAVQAAIEQYRDVIRRARDAYLPEGLYGLATLLHGQGQPAAAGELLDQLIERYPDHQLLSASHLLRGRAWFDVENYDNAHDSFEQVLRAADEYKDAAAYWIAKCDLRRGEPREAADRLRQAVEDYPDSDLAPEMTYDLAVALARDHDADGALQALQQFRELFADHTLMPEALHLMAATLHQLERYEESLQLCRVFEQQFEETELHPSVAYLECENEFLLTHYERAVDLFREFAARWPDASQSAHATFRLGMALYRLNRFEEAEPVLERIAPRSRTEPALHTTLLALGDLHFQQERWATAEALLDEYLSFGLDQPAADDALLKLGLARHRQDRFRDALDAYDRLIDLFPDTPHRLQAVFERGQALVALGTPDEASDAFQQVLQAGTDTPFAVHTLNHLAALAVQRHDYNGAADFYSRVVAIADNADPAAEALFQQGRALMSAERFDRAERAFASLLDSHPDSARRPEARAHLAIALARQSKHADALSAIDRFERSNMNTVDRALAAAVTYEKAWCLRAVDRADDAAGAYRDLLGNPADAQLYCHGALELAELEVSAGRHEEASLILRRLLEAEPPAPQPGPDVREQMLYRLGLCEYNLEHFDLAADLLEEFIETYSDSDVLASASLFCGEALFKTGAHQRAATHLRRIVEDYQDSDAFPAGLLRLGECLAVLQHWARSEEAFALHRQRFPDSELWFQAQFGLAWARENQDRHNQAIETYREIVERHEGPTTARAQFQIGECLFAQGRLEEAVRELLKVDILYAYPEWSAAALYEAGRCFEELNKTAEARAHFQQVQEHHAGTHWAQLASQRLAQLSAASSLPGH